MEYKKIKVLGKEEDEIEINKTDLIRIDRTWFDNKIQIRTSGNLMNHTFYLSSVYDWKIGKDSDGMIVLVPLKTKP